VLGRPAVLPVPAFGLKVLYGEMSQLVVSGVNVVPRRLQELGYRFRRPELEPALRAATGREG
jgi:NAD dependent epimerase/dehydratase family enzyme